jgi:hypothetical protein
MTTTTASPAPAGARHRARPVDVPDVIHVPDQKIELLLALHALWIGDASILPFENVAQDVSRRSHRRLRTLPHCRRRRTRAWTVVTGRLEIQSRNTDIPESQPRDWPRFVTEVSVGSSGAQRALRCSLPDY